MKKLVPLLIIAILAGAPVSANAAGKDLGVAVQVLMGGNDSSRSVSQNNKLWFVIEPGSSGTRDLMIASTSDLPQKIHLAIGARKETNGVMGFDPNGTTKVSDWVSFNKNDFLLAPNKSVQVTMTISVPNDSAREVLQPALLVQAKAAKTGNAQYKIPTAMQFIQGMFLGIGTTESFTTKFTIDDVYGQTTNEGRMIFIRFSNTGGTPINVDGDIQLTSQSFTGQSFGPFAFSTATILPGTSGVTSLPADASVVEDKWRILVRGHMGEVEVTREFTKELTFPIPSPLQGILLNVGLIAVSLAAALWALRTLRRPRKVVNTVESAKPKKFKTNNIVILFFIYLFKSISKKAAKR